jgi:Zn-dependent peptidase ImmA (M78 family)
MPDAITKAAEDVVRTLRMWKLPIDPFAIAEEEEIELAPGTYGERFDGRIEYLGDVQGFVIYYKDAGRSPGRIHFSIGHELGHYYLEEHRARLMAGLQHDSVSDYKSRDERESEADRFSANLLMPEELFRKAVAEFRQNVCTLKDLCELADRLKTSITSTAIRYCDLNIEPATLVVSENGIVQWTWAAEDMKPHGCWFVRQGMPVPNKSQTAILLASGSSGIIGHRVDPSTWFDWPKAEWLYEETMKAGTRMLTWLVLDS